MHRSMSTDCFRPTAALVHVGRQRCGLEKLAGLALENEATGSASGCRIGPLAGILKSASSTLARGESQLTLRPRFVAILLFLVASTALAQDVEQTSLPQNHPLLGTWRIDLPNGCFEEYTLRADGTKLSRSGEERNESFFELSARPSPNGFYRWADKLTKNNGKPDCGGAITPAGHVAVNFILLHQSGRKFLLCEAESVASCYAEFHRSGSDT